MHERHTIERKVQRLATKLNINKQPMVFNIGDLVWLHLRKDRFPHERKSKLRPRTDGPFKVLERYNNNAYKIDIPRDKYSMSDIFNIKDLSWYLIMHNTSDLGSSHVSSGSYVISLRKEVTSVSRALALALVIGPLDTS